MLNREYIVKIAEKKLREGDVPGAVKLIKDVIKDNPKDVEMLNMLAMIYRIDEKLGSAERILKKALKVDPYYPDTHYNLAVIYYERGKYIKAIEEFYMAIENYLPVERRWIADAYLGLGETFYQLGFIDDAIKSWRQAVKFNPANQKARYYLRKISREKLRRRSQVGFVFDFLKFSNLKMNEYLKQRGKEQFDSKKEMRFVLDKIVNVWNRRVSKYFERLRTMTEKEKKKFFSSIKIKF
jgi:tetratricopeptide (TPR) repeat protein